MARKLKFSLIHNNQPIRTLDDLRKDCDLNQLLIDYREGKLKRWLDTFKIYDSLIQAMDKKSSQDDLEVAKELVEILGIETKILEDYQHSRSLITSKADFNQLNQYLAEGKWKEADQETANIMLKIMGRESEGWLTVDNCQNFPGEELKIIDQLWVKYSNGKFGFSVQKQIWLDLGGKIGEYDYDTYKNLADRIGWRKNNQGLSYSELIFDNTALQAHLPVTWVGGKWSLWSGSLEWGAIENGKKHSSLFSSLDYADFTQLNQYLAEGKWKEADLETAQLMLKIMGRDSEGWLGDNDCKNFPREDLKIIDQLWVKYSNGKFGFSVQKQIWLDCGGKVGVYDWDIYCKFADKVGWLKGDVIRYSDLDFTWNAPQAQFPCSFALWGLLCGNGVPLCLWVSSLFSRL